MKKETLFTLFGYVIGGIGGYIYFLAFPCQGGCTVTSSSLITIMLGSFVGGFLFQMVHELFFSKSKNNV